MARCKLNVYQQTYSLASMQAGIKSSAQFSTVNHVTQNTNCRLALRLTAYLVIWCCSLQLQDGVIGSLLVVRGVQFTILRQSVEHIFFVHI